MHAAVIAPHGRRTSQENVGASPQSRPDIRDSSQPSKHGEQPYRVLLHACIPVTRDILKKHVSAIWKTSPGILT
jgi:hypothetical protein